MEKVTDNKPEEKEKQPNALVGALTSFFTKKKTKQQQLAPDAVDSSNKPSKEEQSKIKADRVAYGKKFDAMHRLDKLDIIFPLLAGTLGGIVDCVWGGFVKEGDNNNKPGQLSTFVRGLMEKALPPENLERLQNLRTSQEVNKSQMVVNEMTEGIEQTIENKKAVEDKPLLDFIIRSVKAVSDIDPIDKFKGFMGATVTFLADIAGASGENRTSGIRLPAGVINFVKETKIKTKNDGVKTVDEMVEGMVTRGYDFQHFCAMTVPVMVTEAVTRAYYFLRRLHDGYTMEEAVPVVISREKTPKLGSMLLIGHSLSSAADIGKAIVTRNVLNFNAPMLLKTAKHVIEELKWSLKDRAEMRKKYVDDALATKLDAFSEDLSYSLEDLDEAEVDIEISDEEDVG